MTSTSKSFTIAVRFRKMNSGPQQREAASSNVNGLLGEPCTFKVDGQRFQTSSRTIKFHCDSTYRVYIDVKPPLHLDWLRIAGSDSSLHVSTSSGASSPATVGNPLPHDADRKEASQYWADWKTDGISPTQAGKREAINFALQGPEFILSKTLQCKIYGKSDSHAEWGNALDAIVYKCFTDAQGSLVVSDEVFT